MSGRRPSMPLHVRISSACRNDGTSSITALAAARVTAESRVVRTASRSPEPRPAPKHHIAAFDLAQVDRAAADADVWSMKYGSGSVTHMFGAMTVSGTGSSNMPADPA